MEKKMSMEEAFCLIRELRERTKEDSPFYEAFRLALAALENIEGMGEERDKLLAYVQRQHDLIMKYMTAVSMAEVELDAEQGCLEKAAGITEKYYADAGFKDEPLVIRKRRKPLPSGMGI